MLFEAQLSRKPDLYPQFQDVIETIWSTFWTPSEFNFTADISQFHTELTEAQKGVVVRTLSAIGQIEIAVKTFWANLGRVLPHPTITDLGFAMANNEVIHNLAYEKLLTVLGLEKIFEQNLEEGVVKDRVTYLRKYLEKNYQDDKQQFIYALALFTLFVENVSLFSQFYIITHFNRFENLLPDTAQQVQYTRFEETIHAQTGIALINLLREEYPELFTEELRERVREETIAAFEAESRVIDWILQGYESTHLSSDILKAYIKDRINNSLAEIDFGGLELSDEEKTLLKRTSWMDDELVGSTQTDFFVKTPVEYARNNKVYDMDEIFGEEE